jgi:hypothetical protein
MTGMTYANHGATEITKDALRLISFIRFAPSRLRAFAIVIDGL